MEAGSECRPHVCVAVVASGEVPILGVLRNTRNDRGRLENRLGKVKRATDNLGVERVGKVAGIEEGVVEGVAGGNLDSAASELVLKSCNNVAPKPHEFVGRHVGLCETLQKNCLLRNITSLYAGVRVGREGGRDRLYGVFSKNTRKIEAGKGKESETIY